jgi:hypothetical protein
MKRQAEKRAGRIDRRSLTRLPIFLNSFIFSKGELLVIHTTITNSEVLSDRQFDGLLTSARINIQEVHILNRSDTLGAVVSCDKLVDIKDLETFIRNPDGDGLYVLVEQEGQPQALYSLDQGSPEGSDGRAGVLRMKCQIVFGRQNENSVVHLPEVLDNLQGLNKTIITINKNSGDICTTVGWTPFFRQGSRTNLPVNKSGSSS